MKVALLPPVLAVSVLAAVLGSVQVAAQPCASLLTPLEGAVLDNGCGDQSDSLIWAFDWSDCPGATQYHLYVRHPAAAFALIDDPGLTSSEYRLAMIGLVVGEYRFGWLWGVRALKDGVWTDWIGRRSFDVEPEDTDCPTPVVRQTWGKIKTLYR